MAMNIWLVDIDDTLTHSVDAVILFHNYQYGTELKKEDFTMYSIKQALFNRHGNIISPKEEMNRMEKFYKSSFFENVQPILEMKPVIEAIANRGDIILPATGRAEAVRTQTEYMIIKNFGDYFGEFSFTEWHAGEEKNGTKKSIALKNKVNKVIDDMPGYIDQLSQLEIIDGIYVPQNHWNKSVQETEKVKIITHPQQIIEHAYSNAA
jgi:hypothetical protein